MDKNPFIHYEDLYSGSSRLLLKSAPDPSTANKNSFKATVECVIMDPGEQSLCQRKSIPHGRPTTENARVCLVEVRANGTKRTPVPYSGGAQDGTAKILQKGSV